MISLIEQGFFKRNWGKLALGGGALAFAASRGEDMGYGAAGEAAGQRMGKKVGSMIRGDSPAITKLKDTATNVAKNPNEALQKTAAAVGSGVRKGVDVGKETANSFRKGYSGSAESRSLPDVRRQNLPGSVPLPGAQQVSTRPNVPFTPTRPESIGRADAYKAMGNTPTPAPYKPPNVPLRQTQDYLKRRVPSSYGA